MPGALPALETLALGESFLERRDLPSELRKLVLERTETLRRRLGILTTSRTALAARQQAAKDR